MAYVVEHYIHDYSWEEPCMSCFKQIHYNESEIVNGFYNDDCTASGFFIYCPHCGNKMKVSRTNVTLC
jgi:hypothetical protein